MLIDDGEITTITMRAAHEERPSGEAVSCLMELERATIWMSWVAYVPKYRGVSDFLSPGGRRCFEQGALPRELPWMDRRILNPYATSGLLSRRHRLLIINRPHKRDTLCARREHPSISSQLFTIEFGGSSLLFIQEKIYSHQTRPRD